MKKIKFSHAYKKLLDDHGKVIPHAKLLFALVTELACFPKCFRDYDTQDGLYKLPKTGSYIILTFQKPSSVNLHGPAENLFTTIRRYTPSKAEYYKDAIGENFIIEVV